MDIMPLTLDALKGRIGDLDSHESIPVPRYGEVFGEIGRRFAVENEELWRRADALALATVEEHGEAELITRDHEDNCEINQETVWALKGTGAPGAVNMDRRPAVLDEMGIQRQLIFPMMGIFAWIQALGGGQIWIPPASREQIALGKEAIKAYNRWAGGISAKYGDRMRVVGMLLSGEPGLTPDSMIKQAEAMISSGVKAILISGGEPPAGMSSGDRRLDPFYAALAEKNITLTFHPPAGLGYRKSDVWEATMIDPELASLVTQQPHENFLANMVAGGVFERHPTLRVAFVETYSHWVGPLAEHMDNVVLHIKGGSKLPLKPSEYIARNVRFSVLLDEPVEIWLERWPHLRSVYCSDFPHPEGRPWSLKKFHERIAPLGDDMVEKFFVTNSEWVLPPAS
jgi:predicted TIM-barrel fold metal-dependent hydrolase